MPLRVQFTPYVWQAYIINLALKRLNIALRSPRNEPEGLEEASRILLLSTALRQADGYFEVAEPNQYRSVRRRP